MTDQKMDRPVDMKVTLGNILTIVGLVIGFVGVFYTQGQSAQQQKGDIASLKDSFTELKAEIKDLSGNVNDERLSLTRFEDWKVNVDSHFGQIEDHLKGSDSDRQGLSTRVQALESAIQILNSEKKGR